MNKSIERRLKKLESKLDPVAFEKAVKIHGLRKATKAAKEAKRLDTFARQRAREYALQFDTDPRVVDMLAETWLTGYTACMADAVLIQRARALMPGASWTVRPKSRGAKAA